MRTNTIHEVLAKKFGVWRHDNMPLAGRVATRQALAEVFCELGYKNGVEIGTGDGTYAEILCKANPELNLKCIDNWESNFSASATDFAATQARLAQYQVTFVQKTGLEAVKDIPDRSLDFVYLDAVGNFDTMILNIMYWTPKVRSGGIMSGHDFCHFYRGGVVFAVEAFVRAHNIHPWYITRVDSEPSWLWVN